MSTITRPTVLLNESICRKNIRTMADKCRKLGVGFNPHFKTHQSKEIGEWFREEGVDRITVSSVKMAEYFAEAGWKDITIAFPFNIRETEVINQIRSDTKLTLDIISVETIAYLNQHLKRPANFMIEIDAGYGRTGVLHTDIKKIDAILNEVSKGEMLHFYGFYVHPGHTYDVHGKAQVQTIYDETLSALARLKSHYIQNYPDLKCSVGDTPGCSLLNDFPGIDEIRPGNFVFYDLVQEHVGACLADQIAVVLAAPVVAKEESRNEIIIHAGAVHLSKDSMVKDGRTIYGEIGLITDEGWSAPKPGVWIRKLSQEHGIVVCSKEFFDTVRIGDLLAVYPVHSCLTVDCMKEYQTLGGSLITMMK